jgi:asparagine synthase (glutamine-hydrolysing)
MAAVCFNVNRLLNEAVKMRVDNTDRQVACLLSGGLDSSLITALVAKYVPDPKQLNTFSIGMAGASDLGYAQKVATHLGTNHHEIIVSEEDFFEAIPIVIKAIESYDTTTVRASVGNYLIGKYISENCDAKVIFNGDGSDELFGGYLYMHCAPSSEEFDEETKRLLDNIHYFDVLRSDRCISCHGLEPRTPFMDINLIAYYLSVPCNLRNHRDGKKLPEKYILRKAFSQDNLLPESVLWRTKEAFSDGVSNEENSWHTIIKRRLNGHKKEIMEFSNYDPKLSLEQNYYKQIFNVCYGGNEHVIPYYWMPKFTNATDCSARSLGIYKELQ